MSKIKHSKLISMLGDNMNESVGLPQLQDKYLGFVPSSSSHGEMALERIIEDPGQPRRTFDQQGLAELAASIKAHGVQQPIQLRWEADLGKWVIVYGHRRYRASKLAGMTAIPCTFTGETIDEPTLRVRQLLENCQREDLAPLEMARAVNDIAELTQWNQRRIGEELGLSVATINRFLGLLQLPEDVQDLVRSNKLAPSVANELARIEDRSLQSTTAKDISDQNLNRQQAKSRIRQLCGLSEKQSKTSHDWMTILVRTPHLCIYRSPQVSDIKIKQELIGVIEQLDLEKAET